jgi:serine/threonine-protein kinase
MEALARIDHPGVVSVMDFGHLSDGRPFLVMQYVPGKPLRELIPREGMPLGRMAAIVLQTGRALTAAHEVGVCHRDLKPANIMVQPLTGGEEQVKLIDFGIASVQDLDHASSESKSITGTWEYMAPEQFMGKSSPASDIYQMGVVSYEMATGIVPFRSSMVADLLRQKTKGIKVRPKDLRPDLPDAAEEAILKALAPNPAERYARARDFGEALVNALSGGAAAVGKRDTPAQLLSTETSSFAARRAGVRLHLRRWKLAAALMGLAASAAVVSWLLWPHPADSVAVLPFENRIDDPEMEYLSDGITESLTNDLSRIPTLRVSAHGSVLRYDVSKADPLLAGRELRVHRVVRGSVSRRADDLRIEAELIDVQSGDRLWGHVYTTRMSSLPDALERFSTEVTDHLRLKLSGPLRQRLKRQYAIGEPYQDYLKGRFHLNKRTAEDFETAVRYFNQAIARNAEYAPAYAGLAYTYAQLAMHASNFGNVVPAQALEESRRAAERALQLDGTLAEAYTTLAYVQMQADYQWGAAEENFLRAIDLDPKWADAHECYALELAALKRFDWALRQIGMAVSLEPDAWAFQAARATILYYARRYDESLSVLEGIARDPQLGSGLGDVIAPNYWAKSMPQEALAAVLRLPGSFTPHLRIPLLVSAYARSQQEDKARALLHTYTVRPETAAWYYLALAHMDLGEKTEALRDLEQDYERRSAEILFIAADPMMDGLRADARFHALAAHMNLN